MWVHKFKRLVSLYARLHLKQVINYIALILLLAAFIVATSMVAPRTQNDSSSYACDKDGSFCRTRFLKDGKLDCYSSQIYFYQIDNPNDRARIGFKSYIKGSDRKVAERNIRGPGGSRNYDVGSLNEHFDVKKSGFLGLFVTLPATPEIPYFYEIGNDDMSNFLCEDLDEDKGDTVFVCHERVWKWAVAKGAPQHPMSWKRNRKILLSK